MLTRIHLVRHGETDWNAEERMQGQAESQLTERGRQQAMDTAKQLEKTKFKQIFSSDLKRTRETTEHLTKNIDAPIQYVDALREIHLGPWQGHLRREMREKHAEQFHYFTQEPDKFSLTGAETFFDLQARGLAILNDFVAEHRGHDLLVVCHGTLIQTLLAHFAGRAMKDLWNAPSIHNCAHSIVEFDLNDNGTITRYANLNEW